jgi:predicted ATPase
MIVDLGSRRSPKTNLPAPWTSFIGRQLEMAELQGLLTRSRLVTLIGTGGVGKTRLAQEVGTQLIGRYSGGVWLVELASLADGQRVPQAVASALAVQEAGPRPIVETVIDIIRHQRMLVILDNCEHLVSACAAFAEALLRDCPELRILATSREPLGISGEAVFRVPTLALTPVQDVSPTTSIAISEAARLFVDRAATALPGFEISDQNAPSIARICSQLDGIPLAIELAATWVKVLSVDEIAARLNDRFRLLTGGSRTAPSRQQTLRGMCDWSYDLLEEPERVLFRRLAVFEGGWTLEAAEVVCRGDSIAPEQILPVLAKLVDKSLVLADPQGQPGRFHMLETIRQYGWERLVQCGEAETVCARHAAHYLALAKRAAPRLLGPEQVAWLRAYLTTGLGKPEG